MEFFQQYGLLILVGILIIFMFVSARRRTQKMREAEETKRQQIVPGAKVMLQGGIYGKVAAYDSEDLAAPAFVTIAPDVVIEVHSQAIMQVVDEGAALPFATEEEIIAAAKDVAESAPQADEEEAVSVQESIVDEVDPADLSEPDSSKDNS